MKSLFFIFIITLHTKNLIAQVMPDDIVIKKNNYYSSDPEYFKNICKGIVIHPKVVMTAAECVDGLLPTNLQVENSWHKVSSNVSNVIIHPEYVESDASNNFAILIMDKIIIMRNSIACLIDRTFLNDADLRKCSITLITKNLSRRMNSSSDETNWELNCEWDDKYKENPHFFRSRHVEMVSCKPISKNSECFTYYFAHYSSNKTCPSYSTKDFQIIDLQASFVNNVADWVQNEIQQYVKDVSECF